MANARRTAPASTSDLDMLDVDLNLDDYELERKKPFTFVLNGKRFTTKDPSHIPWQDLQDMDGPEQFGEICIDGAADGEEFIEMNLESGKLEHLLERFRKHYGLGRRGNSRA